MPIGRYRVPIPEAILAEEPALARSIGRTVAVGIRPEAISVAHGRRRRLRGTVVVSEELGSEVISHVEVEATPVRDEAIVEGLTDDVSPGAAPRRVRLSRARPLSSPAFLPRQITHAGPALARVRSEQAAFFRRPDRRRPPHAGHPGTGICTFRQRQLVAGEARSIPLVPSSGRRTPARDDEACSAWSGRSPSPPVMPVRELFVALF